MDDGRGISMFTTTAELQFFILFKVLSQQKTSDLNSDTILDFLKPENSGIRNQLCKLFTDEIKEGLVIQE